MLTSAAQSQIDQYRRDQFKVLLPDELRSLASDPTMCPNYYLVTISKREYKKSLHSLS